MALLDCLDCGAWVSDRARRRPRCGSPLAGRHRPWPVLWRLVAVGVAFAIIIGLPSLGGLPLTEAWAFASLVAAVVIVAVWERLRR